MKPIETLRNWDTSFIGKFDEGFGKLQKLNTLFCIFYSRLLLTFHFYMPCENAFHQNLCALLKYKLVVETKYL